MEISDKQEQNSKTFPQFFAGIVAVLNSVSVGCVFGWTSPALPLLQGSLLLQQQNSSTPYPLSEGGISVEEGSLVGSLIAVGALVASVPSGHLANLLGRRRLTQAISTLLVVGWIIITVCDRHVLYLFLARFLHGMCMGIGSVVTPLYNEEISEVCVRGSLGVLYDSAICLGILWVYLAGAVMPYPWMNITSALPAVMSFVLLFFIPESPVHLLIHGDDEKAKAALSWLRGKNYDVEPEMSAMRKLVERAKEASSADLWPSTKKLTLRSFCSPTAKSLFIITGLMVARQLSGVNPVTFYAEDILRASGSAMEPPMAATLCALLQLMVTVLMIAIADLAGRRILLVVSCWGSALSLVGLALGPPGWLPVLSVMGYITLFSVGLGPLPWFMMAELIPTEAKGWVTGCAATVNWLLMFLVTHFFASLLQAVGALNTFVGYATVNALAGVAIMLCVLETRGKTLEEIQKELGAE